MFRLLILLTTILFSALRVVLRSRSDLFLENIALRQQLEALRRSRRRPRLDDADRAFWLAMRSAWRGWAARLILVQPDTVVRWHRDRFRRYWSDLSRHPGPGRPRVNSEVRDLIRRMTLENDWGAPRIHGELVKLGFTVSEATVSRYMPRRPANPEVVQRWLAFLRDQVEGIAAMPRSTRAPPGSSNSSGRHSPTRRRRGI
jgi:putative transposase